MTLATVARLEGKKDTFLAIAGAGSSLEYDRTGKAPLYATVGIPERWIMDVNHQTIEAYSQPSTNGYQQIRCRYE